MLKSAISLLGSAIRWLFTQIGLPPLVTLASGFSIAGMCCSITQALMVMLLDKPNEDLYAVIRCGIVGMPCIVFHCYHKAGRTRIREKTYGDRTKLCDKVVGVNANAFYLWE